VQLCKKPGHHKKKIRQSDANEGGQGSLEKKIQLGKAGLKDLNQLIIQGEKKNGTARGVRLGQEESFQQGRRLVA